MKPYYVTQIKTILEKEFSDDIVYQAIEQLTEEKKLSKFIANTKYAGKVTFVYNAKLDRLNSKHSLNTHIQLSSKLIDKYSKPNVAKRYADHLEDLVEKELQMQGFTITDNHTNKYKNKQYTKTNNDLDFIAEHHSGKLTIGVEVKNTLSVLDKKEADIKIDMCHNLGITPVFAVRHIKPYINLIEDKGGFPWIFKTQLYPPDLESLTIMLSQRLHLPVNTATELPSESVQLFHNWVKNKTGQSYTET